MTQWRWQIGTSCQDPKVHDKLKPFHHENLRARIYVILIFSISDAAPERVTNFGSRRGTREWPVVNIPNVPRTHLRSLIAFHLAHLVTPIEHHLRLLTLFISSSILPFIIRFGSSNFSFCLYDYATLRKIR